MKTRSLAAKFTITFLIIVLAGQGIGFVLFVSSIRKNLLDSLNGKIQHTGEILSKITIKPILDKDDSSMSAYLEELIKDDDLVSISVFDKDQTLIAEKTKIYSREGRKLNPLYVESYLKRDFPVFSGNARIGEIAIMSSSSRINREILKQAAFGALHQGLLIMAVILLVAKFFSSNVRKPVLDFNLAVGRLGAGDLTASFQSEKNIEMIMLAKGFNALTGRFKDIVQKLHFSANNVTKGLNRLNEIIDQASERAYGQIGTADETVTAIERAEITQRQTMETAQELARFAQENSSSFSQMEAALKELNEKSKELSQYSGEAYSTIITILGEAATITKNSEELSISVEETTAAVEQIGANLKEIKDITIESERLASEVREVLSGVREVELARTFTSIGNVESAVERNLELVRNLETKSKDVEKVLTVVADVTKKTNLLSVNAAILASQAGEYGSGFSVVADEIKTLAARTASSAKEITNIIQSIQKEIADTIIVTEDSKKIVSESRDLVLHTDTAIEDVLKKAQISSDMTRKIQRASEEQVRGIMQLNQSMNMLMSISSNVTEIVRSRESKSVNLLTIAERFKDIAYLIKSSAQDQYTGIHVITKNLDFTSEMIKVIDSAAAEQEKAGSDISALSKKIKKISHETITVTQEMTESFNNLYKEVEMLKKDMEGFKVG